MPFTLIDEAVHALDTLEEPWSIQLELRVAGHLDETRLRAALVEALRRHPMARVRLVPSRRADGRHLWEITPEPELDPLRVVDCPDEAALPAIRSELQSLRVPLAESPPVRARLVRHPGGDLIMFNVNHAAFDGFGSVRLMHSVARAYAGRSDPSPPVPLEDARDVRGRLATDDLAVRVPRWRMLAGKLRDLVSPPARLACDEGADRPGYEFHHLRLSVDDTAALSDLELPATVNDLLVAALHLAVASWNAGHVVPSRRRIGVLVPVNLRPKGWRQDIVTNFSLPARVVTSPRDRATPRRALEAVAAQGKRVRGPAGAALIEVLRRIPSPPALQALSGSRLGDTALLSNLGLIDEPPSFGPDAGETTELWFSAPAQMPCGLSLGAATVGGQLHLAFRYRHPLLGPHSIRRFADCYLRNLEDLSRLSGKTLESAAKRPDAVGRLAAAVDRAGHVTERPPTWAATAAVMAVGGQGSRRAALRGSVAYVLAGTIANLLVKPFVQRQRPPGHEEGTIRPLTSSFPSGHAATDTAFTFAAAQELPALFVPLAAGAAAAHWSRVRTGSHYFSDVFAGGLVGTAVAWGLWKAWPPAPRSRP